jgi:acyl-CoA synthetase (AMP-forming)/AMP-acid ligase II
VHSPLLFDGYVDDEAATGAAFDDGWYRTGDRAELDAEGYVFITGRTSQLIRTGGEGVDPSEVEQVLADHPGVADVAVVGVPDADWGEVVCAVVVTAAPEGAAPSVDDLRRHCEGRLAAYKQPRRVELADAIPRTEATQQVQRALIIEQLAVGPVS